MGLSIWYPAMSWWTRRWFAGIRARFDDREDIGRQAVYERLFAEEGLPKNEVFEIFDFIESEYGPIAGLLRPQDNLVEKFFTPVKTNNPLRWGEHEIRAGDGLYHNFLISMFASWSPWGGIGDPQGKPAPNMNPIAARYNECVGKGIQK
jgi:hypothetical protein